MNNYNLIKFIKIIFIKLKIIKTINIKIMKNQRQYKKKLDYVFYFI